MLKYVSTLLFVICLVLAGCDTAGPDPEEGPSTAIVGQVLVAGTDTPLSGATVTTIPATSNLTTDENGEFVFENIEPGDYRIIAKASGYVSETVDVTVEADQRKTVTISLKEKADDPVDEQGALMPLQVGNSWTLQLIDANGEVVENGSYIATLTETQEIDGNTYYQLLVDYGDGVTLTNQFIGDSTAGGERVGTLFLATTDGGNETTFFQYPIEDGASYEYTEENGETRTYHVERETIEVPTGTFTAYTYSGYVLNEDGTVNEEVSISFAPGIGFVRLTHNGGGASVLVDCDTETYSCSN